MPNEINPKDFIKAGKAIFTLHNTESGNRFTYKVKKLAGKDLWFVSVLNGPDNYRNYRYMGTIFGDNFRRTAKSRIGEDATSYKAFVWLNGIISKNKALPDNVKVYHEGRCGRCGRRLTVPESIKSGFGPECITKVSTFSMPTAAAEPEPVKVPGGKRHNEFTPVSNNETGLTGVLDDLDFNIY